MNIKISACTFALAAGLATTGFAQTFVQFGSAGGWTVFTNTDDKTCVAERSDGDLLVQMGALASKDVGYIGVFTRETPEGLQQGADLIVTFDNGNNYTATEEDILENKQGYSGAFIEANNPAFIADVANAQTMKVVDTDRSFELDLTGTKAAMEMAFECAIAANS
ncbi:hypothetical protein ACFORG_15155 [Lutimaribacter marinistellae]|uniref:Invasion protein IalB, involved in pathogenesis n=1 Tax=Lutimaribacter marinistellae TaxID=1820329 RepID=A0ABV7TKY3_9RHOB